jgi:hypothetical protein
MLTTHNQEAGLASVVVVGNVVDVDVTTVVGAIVVGLQRHQ